MIAMPNEPSTNLRGALMVCMCGILLALPMAASAQQAQDDDDTFEQKIIKNILGGMGVDVGRAGIDYRERSPLVIPPSRDLPPPGSETTAVKDPAWPHEPEQPRRKATGTRRTMNDSVRTMNCSLDGIDVIRVTEMPQQMSPSII